MNIKQEAEFLGKAVTRMDGRADTLTEIIACLEIDLEKLERENFGLRQQIKIVRAWGNNDESEQSELAIFSHLFSSVQWEDKEPVRIDDYVKR